MSTRAYTQIEAVLCSTELHPLLKLCTNLQYGTLRATVTYIKAIQQRPQLTLVVTSFPGPLPVAHCLLAEHIIYKTALRLTCYMCHLVLTKIM